MEAAGGVGHQQVRVWPGARVPQTSGGFRWAPTARNLIRKWCNGALSSGRGAGWWWVFTVVATILLQWFYILVALLITRSLGNYNYFLNVWQCLNWFSFFSNILFLFYFYFCLGKNNVAFLSYFITGQTEKCLDLLVATNRLPEAAFFARTYLPSQVCRFVEKRRCSASIDKIVKRDIRFD